MTDIIERAEAATVDRVCPDCGDQCCSWERQAALERAAELIPELVAELKAARAEVQQRREQAEMWEAAVKRARAEDYQWRKDISKELLELRERLRGESA